MTPVQSIKAINGLLKLMTGPDTVWRYQALRIAMYSSDDFAKRACKELFDIGAAKRISGGIISGYVYEAAMTVPELKKLIRERNAWIVKNEEAKEVEREARALATKMRNKIKKHYPVRRPNREDVVFKDRGGVGYPVYNLAAISAKQPHNIFGA